MSETLSPECPMPTSTDGKPRRKRATAPSGALSSHQITALIQQGRWWPFDRVDGKILVRMNATLMRNAKQQIDDVEEALL